MRTGLTTAIDYDGVPFVIADERTPFVEQRRELLLIKAGQKEPPPNCAEINLWQSDRGIVLRWIGTNSTAAIAKPIETIIETKGKKMKKILGLLALAALFAVPAKAQVQTVYGGIVYSNAATTNLASPIAIDCRRQKDVALMITWKLNGAGTDVSGFKFQRSVDGTLAGCSGVDEYWFRKASAGATGSTIVTNITMSGYPYLLLTVASNATAAYDITNVTIKYWVKPNAP